jgi:hypothetical protein
MAREVYVWAVKRKVKGIALNQVFLHIASWAGPDGFCKFRSVRDIAELAVPPSAPSSGHWIGWRHLSRKAGWA